MIDWLILALALTSSNKLTDFEMSSKSKHELRFIRLSTRSLVEVSVCFVTAASAILSIRSIKCIKV